MIAVVTPEKLQLSSGTVVRLLSQWTDYQLLLQRRGNKSNPRLKYRNGETLSMSPLAKHGRDANAIADFIKILLDHLGQDYEAFTPITLDILTQNTYRLSKNSLYFPNLEIAIILTDYLEQVKQQSSSVAMRLLRKNFPSSL